ncbi:hypothetical protein AB0F42_05145 [Streptomyces buecherae]|uniref:hypothetical protein n=1 Tax=Streptomyces buecherae TaxID=2763006 RepID=UPI0033C3E10D
MSSKQNRRPAQRGRKPAAAARKTQPAKRAAASQAAPQPAARDESSVTPTRAGGPAGGSTAGQGGEPGASAAQGASAPSGPRPARLTGAAIITAAEGALLAAYGVYLMVMGLAGDPDSPKQTEILAVVFFALAALPLVAARGLWLRRRWSRGPAMITQIMALPVAWTLINSGGALIAGGIAIGVVALAALVLLVNPTATEALGIGPRDA